jgi:hypothetical protein
VEFRILGPLEVLEDGHQVVRHRTRALRARPAGLARFIEEQRAPPGSTHSPPVDPPPTWGNSVIGSGEIRPIVLTVRMERLWSQAGATSGNRWQVRRRRNRLR